MQLSNIPDYRANLSRHGHNLSHDFSFTSSTGHLLTVFAQHMNPEEHIKGHIDMFSRTQPLNGCPNADIDQYIDYFFVPYDMFWMGFGENFFQTNEPFSTAITINDGSLPLFDFTGIENTLKGTGDYPMSLTHVDATDIPHIYTNMVDSYGLDCMFMSAYRNMFHNFINPNVLFYPVAEKMIGANPVLDNYQIPFDFFQPNVFPAVLMAYNCVYEHFYRIDDREQFDASIYNIDKFLIEGKTLNDVDGKKFFSLKYRPRHFDYFTAGSVAPLINPQNLVGGSSNSSLLDINNYLSQVSNNQNKAYDVTYSNNASSHDLTQQPIGSVGLTGTSSVPTTQSIRSLFAIEKILSVTNRAKKTYDAQVLAHFGVKVPKDVKHQIQFLGSQHGNIHIGEIISTANTASIGTGAGSSLGDIAGKGYGNLDNKGIDFTAPCHGIVIGIYSCVPKVRYYVGTTKQWSLTNRLDFYIPAYEHLGMQPIYRWEGLQIPTGFAYQGSMMYQGSTKVLGWQMRYGQYKKQISRVSPAFAKTITTNSILDRVDTGLSFNSWSNWLISERPFCPRLLSIKDGTNSLELRDYLANPSMLNDLFVYQYPDVRFNSSTLPTSETATGGYNDLNTDIYQLEVVSTPVSNRQSFAWNLATLFYFDPLLHFADVKMKLVSTMSDNTLPELAAV